MLTPKIIVVNALISGDTPFLIIEYTFIGNVAVSAFARKLVMIRSSSANENAINAPDITPGTIAGSVTCMNV